METRGAAQGLLSELLGWLQRDGLHVPSELTVFEVLVRWAEQDAGARKASFESLFCDAEVLRLPQLSPEDLTAIVASPRCIDGVKDRVLAETAL